MIQEVLENMREPLQCSITKELITNCTLGIHPENLLLVSSEMFDLISESKSEDFLMNCPEFQKSSFIPLFDPSIAKSFKKNKDAKEVIQNICKLEWKCSNENSNLLESIIKLQQMENFNNQKPLRIS
jgi:hypothetical protein